MATATTPALDPTIVEQDGNVASADAGYGPNNEQLEKSEPDVVAALKTLVEQFRTEGATGRREEIRRIKQARLFEQGKHFGNFWSEAKGDWRPISESPGYDKNQQSGSRYEFVTNLYSSFEQTFISVITQDVPVVKFYPESANNPADIATAKAASDISELIEDNNNPEELLGNIGRLMWTDGKLGAYMRYVADGQRFGWSDQPEYATQPMDVGNGQMLPSLQVKKTSRIPKGRELIAIVDGLQLNTPVWASDQREYPYLQWSMEVYLAKLKASYPDAADKFQQGGGSSEQAARNARVELSTGASDSGNRTSGALNNLITYERTWIRPWAFYSVENKATRDKLLQLFPDGCYVAFAGDVYCESRDESMDDHWRVLHALPGDGQNRPAVGTSTISVNERYNTLANQQAENSDYGIPATYADPQVLDFDSLAGQVAEPGAIYPAKARPGQSLANGFYQPPAATMTADAIRHMEALFGPIPQFMSGLFPAIFGGEMSNVDTAAGYSMAREQALGRVGLVWRRVKEFYAQVMLLGVECFRENRTEDTEIPQLGAGGEYESKMIRMADLKGNCQCRPEADDQYPRMKSQQRAALSQLMTVPDPDVAKILAYGSNPTFIKDTLGLTELEIPGEDARQKQMREIEVLLQGMPVPIDPLLDDNQTEFEECKRWASSEEGQQAKVENLQGFATVRDHAMQHDMAVKAQMMPALPAAPPQEGTPQ